MTNINWKTSPDPISYLEAIQTMEKMVGEIAARKARDTIWLVKHPSIYTNGTNAKLGDIIAPLPHPLYHGGRGGKITYHGPGQRLVYTLINLKHYRQDIHHFVWALEEWIIAILNDLGIKGVRFAGNPGVWVEDPKSQNLLKIAAIGIRVRKWVTYHGFSLNISPEMSNYDPIIPCGIKDAGVTSLEALGLHKTVGEVDVLIKKNLPLFLEKLSN